MTPSSAPLKKYLTHLIKDFVTRLTVFVLGLDKDKGRRECSLAFDRGQDVDFGAVVLSREGINLGDCIIPWSALRSFRVSKRNIIFVRQCGNHFQSLRVPTFKVHNLPEMLYLVEVAGGGQKASTDPLASQVQGS